MFRSSQPRNLQSRRDRKMLADALDNGQLTRAIQQALHRALGNVGAPIKTIAREIGCSPRTARNYWEGENAPNLEQAMKLARKFDEVREVVFEAMGHRPATDPKQYAADFLEQMARELRDRR